jgi:outer membrane immunogenic protein
MKTLWLSTISAMAFIASSAVASAADLRTPYTPPPPAPIANWNGFYLGANGGWGWTDVNAGIAAVGAASIVDFGAVDLSSHARGAVFGGQLGYNWQLSPNWVLGFEGDFDGAGITGTSAVVKTSGLLAGVTDGFLTTDRLNWLATVRGRIGYTWGPGLFYFTGGGAWENSTRNVLVSTNTLAGIFGNSAAASFDNTKSGFVLGVGLEWMVTQNWTARLEYLNYDFNNSNNSTGVAFTFPSCARPGTCGAIASASERDLSVFRVGANYKW